jgi:hypothetical protein
MVRRHARLQRRGVPAVRGVRTTRRVPRIGGPGNGTYVAKASGVVVANDGAAISDANFARPTGAALVIWPMANGVTPVNAVWPDIINTASA